ncbi:MAG: MoaD/ThiS family protein [Halanaeroarchaeum sp.]
MVAVRVYGPLRQHVDEKAFEHPLPPQGTIRALVQSLASTYPGLGDPLLDDEGRVSRSINVLVDGRHVDVDENPELDEGVTVSLAPRLEGG